MTARCAESLRRAPHRSLRPLAFTMLVILVAAACSSQASPTPAPATARPSPAPTAAPAASEGPAQSAAAGDCPKSAPPPLAADDLATVTLDTNMGPIVIQVDGKLAPAATANFVALAACGFYDGVIFHRVVPGFVIQAGDGQFGREPAVDWQSVGRGGPGYTIPDDPVTTPYARGVVAMARTPQPNSQGSQFFIVLDDGARSSLQSANTYAILGSVVDGMETVDAIAGVPISADGRNAPTGDPPPTITKATVSRP